MSDNIKDLCKEYEENVGEPRARSVGLVTIPEYPEYEVERGMWSTALDAIWTTLRYLAPATLLTLLWGHQSFIFKLLKYIDSAFRALLFSSEDQKQAVLQWLGECGPVRVDDLGTVWRHGWILCGVLDAALPGACAGHPPTSLSLKHAQAIAEHYLGVVPMFSRQELEVNDNLSKHQEWRLIQYIDSIRQALIKVTPPITKPSLQKLSPDTNQFIFDYVARGSGLTAAEIDSTMYFKIFPTSQQSLDPSDLKIVIKGPDNSYGVRVLPPILGKAQLIRQQRLGLRTQTSFTENTLPLAHGATYLRNYGKNDMNKTYYIPKTKYDIEIETETAPEHVKIGYTVKLEGKYEISIISKGQNIVGSPYIVTASKNVIKALEKESFSLEDGEEIDIVDVKSDRKVVLRIVDFVTEKMLLKENGVLEKISDDEAKYLMENNEEMKKSLDLNTEKCNVASTNECYNKGKRFNEVANKVLKLNNICKLFYDIKSENENVLDEQNIDHQSRQQQDIPDIVNSTLSDAAASAFMLSNKRDKFIVPENISVSILTERTDMNSEYARNEDQVHDDINLAELKVLRDVSFADDNDSEDGVILPNNPFLNESSIDDNKIEKMLHTFAPSEYETNKQQSEETHDNTKTMITVENSPDTIPSSKGNPFIDFEISNVDRPKSPVFKIFSEDRTCTTESTYMEADKEDNESTVENELLNPFSSQHSFLKCSSFKQSLPIADFIIGAPVSLPPEMRSLPQEAVHESLDAMNKKHEDRIQLSKDDENTQSFAKAKNVNITKNDNSIESFGLSEISDLPYNVDEGNISPKKEMWDSAYVSIDENITAPDNNNNDNNLSKEVQHKQKNLIIPNLSSMGPAEREIWENCAELQEMIPSKLQDVSKSNKLELNISRFTPIIEESDRSFSLVMKGNKSEVAKSIETDPVTIAFAEINELYNDYFQNSEDGSITNEDKECTDLVVNHKLELENGYVESASVKESDVMRHITQTEGKTFEIQANVTESVSVSQTLHDNGNNTGNLSINDQIKFGDNNYTNIVLEKKKYWDEKIKQIQAEESRIQQRKRRLSAKQLRHNDSLSKRRGKQMVKKYLSNNEAIQKQCKASEHLEGEGTETDVMITENNKSNDIDVAYVKNWKTFWDNKLESESEMGSKCLKTKFSKTCRHSSSDTEQRVMESNSIIGITEVASPVKQEIPEEVFKAFETSPKRFFGTSRKQILNKLDTFSGKPNTEEETLINDDTDTYESGLVSSRISLFHTISQTENLSWAKIKSKSMHNISHRKYSESATENNLCQSTKNIIVDQKENVFNNQEERIESERQITLKEKRARVTDIFYTKSVDSSSYYSIENDFPQDSYVKKTIQMINRQQPHQPNHNSFARKLSSSKSEMDIFNKFSNKSLDEDFDKYKSCEDLPKVSVKNFISLYEDVSKNTETNSTKKCGNKTPEGLEKHFKSASSTSGTAGNESVEDGQNIIQNTNDSTKVETANYDVSGYRASRHENVEKFKTSLGTGNKEKSTEDDAECRLITAKDFDRESTYISLSDIEIEIVENRSEKSIETSPERDIEIAPADYKSRFKIAKQYFQSLEELREIKNPKKLNECELLLIDKSTESLEGNNQNKRPKKKVKSNTMPSTQISEFWNQMREQENQDNENKPVKISEKFHVEDLFTDVMEGRLSRQGSLRGIPHKKAVLEAFKSMENISDNNLSPYELAVSQFSDYTNEKKVQNAQTYLNEYPYLPTTDPSKSHSRLDVNASGLISFKELLNKKERRNSVPDLRLNPSFTVDL